MGKTSPGQYRVKNWDEFQHYRDRKPQWLKLHRHLLDDFEFHSLPVASRAILPMLWLLASEYQDASAGVIDADHKKIAFRLRMTEKEATAAIEPLVSSGFIMFVRSDTDLLAALEQDASLERETETERETEVEPPQERASASAKAVTMPFDTLPLEWQEWACREFGWNLQLVGDVWATFRDYWKHGKGKSVKREGWESTWRNWCRKEAPRLGRPSQGHQRPQQQKASGKGALTV